MIAVMTAGDPEVKAQARAAGGGARFRLVGRVRFTGCDGVC